MSSFCKITIGKTPGATRANAMYITRSGACEVWETRNVPDEEHLGITREDQRGSIADYLCELAEEGRGQRRDYRAVLSFDCEVEPERAMEMAEEWIEATPFRDNPALYACHTNTDNLHIHVLVTARDTEGHKLDLSDREYKSFDKEWAKVYDRELERGANNEHSRKCEATQSWKEEYAAQRDSGRDREEIVAELGNIPRDTPTISEYYQEKRTHDEQSLADSLGHEHGLLRGVQEDYRGAGPESGEPSREDPGARDDGRGTDRPTDEVRGSLQDVEDQLAVLRDTEEGSRGTALPAQEAIRDGAGRAQEETLGDVQGAERTLRGDCEAGDRQGRQECEGERAERGGNLQELCAQLAEGFRERVAHGIEELRDAFHSIGEALKSLPELKEIVQEFREWRDAAWERVTRQSYGREQEKLQSSQGQSKKLDGGGRRGHDRDDGWSR